MDPDVFPNTIDYWGPAGMVFLRNPQIRWTPVHQENLSLALALEIARLGGRPGQDRDDHPRSATTSPRGTTTRT